MKNFPENQFIDERVSRKWFDRLSYYCAREYPIDSGATDSSIATIDTNCVPKQSLLLPNSI